MANDSDNAVKILIEFGLNDAAARQAVERMNELKGVTGEGTLATGKMADAVKDLGKNEDAASEHADKLHISHRALHQILHLIGHAAGPEAGIALGAIGAVSMGSAMLGVMAFRSLFEAIKKSKEEAAKFTEDMGRGDFAATCKAMGDSVSSLATETQKFADARGEQAKHEVTIAQAYASQLSYLFAIEVEQNKLIELQAKIDKSKTKQKEATGQITPDQATIENAKADIAAAAEKLREEKEKTATEIKNKQSAYDNGTLAQRGLDSNFLAAQKAAAEHKAGIAGGEEQLFSGTNQEFEKKRDDWAKNATADAEGMFSKRSGTGISNSGYASESEADKDRAKIEKWKKEDKAGEILNLPETHGLDIEAGLEKLERYDAAIKNMEHGRSKFISLSTPGSAASIEQQRLEDSAGTAKSKSEENNKEMEALRKELEKLRLLNGPEIEKAKDAEFEKTKTDILINAITKLTTGTGANEKAGTLGLEFVKMKGLADKGAGNLDKSEIGMLEDFAYSFKFTPKEKAAGAKIKNVDEAIKYIEDNTSDQQIFDLMDRFISLGQGANRRNKDTMKEVKRISTIVDALQAEMNRIDSQHKNTAKGGGTAPT